MHSLGEFSMILNKVKQRIRQGNWGDIINFTSLVGLIGSFGQANYSASKAGVLELTMNSCKNIDFLNSNKFRSNI